MKVEDLQDHSNVLIDVQCDGCEKILTDIIWESYKKCLHEDGKYYCQKCGIRLFGKVKALETTLKNLKLKREGEERINNYGSKMKLIEYISNSKVIIKFNSGHIKICTYDAFKNGRVKDPLDLLVLNNSCIGDGKYNNLNYPHIYRTWNNMLKRCYDPKLQESLPTYIGCTVCDEWHNFQNFAKWHEENYYEIEGHRVEIDKDILIKGNKIYSPENCCFVPHNINILYVKNKSTRGVYPIGVYFQSGKYYSLCNDINGNQKYLGRYKTPELAFNAYKEYKEQLIKKVAQKYCGIITNKVYNALMEYNVDIED